MAPPSEPPEQITLRIKVPPGTIEGGADEYTLANPIPVTTRVGQLRDQIQASLPSNPAPAQQRLLYAGRALIDNEQTIADALNIRREPTQTEYVVHLLVRNTSNAAPGHSTTSVPAPTPSAAPPAQQHGLPDVQRQHEVLRQQQAMIHQMMEQQQRALGIGLPGHQQQMHMNVGGVPPAQPTGEQAQPAQPPAPGVAPIRHVFLQGVGPNGEQIAVHQQRVHFHTTHHLPPGAQGLPPHEHWPGVHAMQPTGGPIPSPAPQQQQQRPALDLARESIAELRRLLEEVRAENTSLQATPEQVARIARLEEQARTLNDYIDPFGAALGNGDAAGQPARVSQSPWLNRRHQDPNNHALPIDSPLRRRAIPPESMLNPRRHFDPNDNAQSINSSLRQRTTTHDQAFNPDRWRQQQQIRTAPRLPPPFRTSPEDVACYLLSDPSGVPQAVLLSPQHGTFTGRVPTATQPTAPAANQNHVDVLAPGALGAAQVFDLGRAQENNGNVNNLDGNFNPMGLLLAHFWMIFRLAIFGYFIMGTNLGWRRPLAFALIAGAFWLVRAGLLGDGGAARRWWEGIVREGAAVVGQQQQENGAAAAGAMPTPEEVARRLLEERRGEGEWMRWIRARVRPVERALALLVASLWPGVGEGFVRAREEEVRRAAEAEIAEARRRQAEAEERANAETGEQKGDGKTGDAAGEGQAIANGEEGSSGQKSEGGTSAVET